jgi:MPBQ/MSBQ methyltransferase
MATRLMAELPPDLTSGNTSIELLFCTDVLGLPSLHYGYWNDGEELSLENLKLAQKRYTDQLATLVPVGVQQILDVGCGTGDIARVLAAKGHHVTAISPDDVQRKVVQSADSRITYFNVRFEDLDIDRAFDLILMAESQNYIDIEIGFRQCRRYLPNGGYLLVSGIFGRADAPRGELPGFIENTDENFVSQAGRYGFRLVSCEDITGHVLPTLTFSRATYEQYVLPTIGIAGLWLSRRPFIGKLVRLALNKEIHSLERVRGYYMERFDAELFARTCRYLTQLFVYEKRIVATQ